MHSDFSYAQLQGKILPQFLKILWKRHTCVVWTMNTLLSVPTHRCGLSRVNKGRPVPGQANCTVYLLQSVKQTHKSDCSISITYAGVASPFNERTCSVCWRGVQGHGWGDTEFANSAEWCSSHQWATAWISVHFASMTQQYGDNVYGTQKMQCLRQIWQSAWPLLIAALM